MTKGHPVGEAKLPELLALAICRELEKQFEPPTFTDWQPIAEAAAETVATHIRERAKQRPSDGLMQRQKLGESHVRYGQALLSAVADEISRKDTAK